MVEGYILNHSHTVSAGEITKLLSLLTRIPAQGNQQVRLKTQCNPKIQRPQRIPRPVSPRINCDSAMAIPIAMATSLFSFSSHCHDLYESLS